MADPKQGAIVAPETSKRAEEVRSERRRRADTTHEYSHRLSVNEALLDHTRFAYRFINDTGGRLHERTVNDDWDVVKDPSVKSDADGNGAPVRKLVGTNLDGSPVYAYLCQKPIEYHRADRAQKQRRTDETMKSIVQGKSKDPDALSIEQPTAYIPSDGGTSVTYAQAKATSYKP
jgi:hypothetical protein